MPAEDPLDASLQDFEPHLNSPTLLRHLSPHQPPSEPATTDPDSENDGSLHPLEEDSEIASLGGYSPPAWRRLANGDRSSGFWRAPTQHHHDDAFPAHQQSPFAALQDPMVAAGGSVAGRHSPREGSPEDDDQEDVVLEQAMRTRLPRGSQSPAKARSMSPFGYDDDPTLRVPDGKGLVSYQTTPTAENYIRFALRAEMQHATSPLTTSILKSLRSSPFLLIFLPALLLIVVLVLQPAAPLPTADLIKVAGVARSFEPLIYYSEHAVVQVHDLQATSVAVWDLAESVRSSDLDGGPGIVKDLDELSETMRTLAVEMTKFHSKVDGDIDGILNVMNWVQVHLNRLSSSPPPSALSTLYGHLSPLVPNLPPSVSQLQQTQLQLLFTEFITTLESSITSELHHSLLLLSLFESVDASFLNLARAVVRESTAQENLHSDMLSNLWSRILGPQAAAVKKFEQNRALLRNVREKTVRNKGLLVEHNGKLLTLKASLESLRAKLVSPLVRSANATTLTLEDQIKGLADVSEYLADVRRRQKGRVMESMYASVPGKKYHMIDQHEAPAAVDVNYI